MNMGPKAVPARPGCGFLSEAELEAWLDGQLDRERRAAFEDHLGEGCTACALAGADIDAFAELVARGPLPSERAEFERSSAAARAALLAELRRSGARRWRGSNVWLTLGAGLAAAALVAVAILPLADREGGAIALPGGGRVALDPPAFSPPPEVRDRQRTIELWTRAEQAWQQESWEQAGESLARIVKQDPESHDAMLYLGLALLAQARHDEAVERLVAARRLAETQGLAGALDDYYLGLAALGAGDVELGREALGRAAETGGAWGERARVLLAELG